MGRPIRRVLSLDGHLSRRYVAATLMQPTRCLGEQRQRHLSGLAPGEVYRANSVTRIPGGLLHHRFTLTLSGGLFSVALSRGLLRVGVTHHPALWSPDVPRHLSVTRPPGRPIHMDSLATPRTTDARPLICWRRHRRANCRRVVSIRTSHDSNR